MEMSEALLVLESTPSLLRQPLAIDKRRYADAIVITARIPGAIIDQSVKVNLAVNGDLLEISVWCKELALRAAGASDGPEVVYQHFLRSVALPPGVSEPDIEYYCEDGILEVRVGLQQPIFTEFDEPSQQLHVV